MTRSPSLQQSLPSVQLPQPVTIVRVSASAPDLSSSPEFAAGNMSQPQSEAQAQTRDESPTSKDHPFHVYASGEDSAEAAAPGPSARSKINRFLLGGFGRVEPEPEDFATQGAPRTQRSSQTDWYLTDAPKLEHGLRRTFNPASTYRRLDSLRGAANISVRRVRLVDIEDAVDKQKLLLILRFIIASGVLLVASGGAFLLHLVVVTIAKDSAEYLGLYMENHFGTMLLMCFFGIFHPIVIGLYSGKHLNSFYWRASATLIVPVIVLGLCVKTLVYINRNLESDFHVWLLQYPGSTQSQKMWDTAQTSLRCCGLQGYSDWTHYNKTIPDSCCVEVDTCDIVESWWHRGCLSLLQDDLHMFIGVYISILSCQVIFQVMAIVEMRVFYTMIREFLPSEPTLFQILIGPCASVTDACRSCCSSGRKTKFEFEETHDLEYDLLPRDKYGDLRFKAPFPWKS